MLTQFKHVILWRFPSFLPVGPSIELDHTSAVLVADVECLQCEPSHIFGSICIDKCHRLAPTFDAKFKSQVISPLSRIVG